MKLNKVAQETPEELFKRLERTQPKSKAGAVWSVIGCGTLLLVLVGTFGYLGVLIWGENDSAQTARKQAQAAAQQLKTDHALGLLYAEDRQDIELACEASLKSKLKTPATAQIMKNSDATWTGNVWRYSGSVDSANSFGAVLRSQFDCTVSGSNRASALINVDLQP